MKFTNEQLIEMLEAQEELNNKFTAGWRTNVQHKEFFTAIFTEVAEFLESSPEEWKWWKRQWLKNDKQNQYIEIVDVMHFGLSYMMYTRSIDEIIKENYTAGQVSGDVFDRLEAFRKVNSLQNFYGVLQSMVDYSKELKSDELVRIYFEKLAINHKRVDGGYTEGTYVKVDANGNEDNRVIEV